MELFLDGKVMLYCGDSRDVLRELPDNSLDSACMDPPYALVSISKRFGKEGAAPAKAGATGAYARASAGFMGKQWDTGETAFAVEFWELVLAKLKPGAHLAAFSGTRTYHRMACAIEDAGFEIRDQLAWCYGSGFPKSHDIAKAIDKAAGVEFSASPAAGVGFMGADGPAGYNPTINQLERVGEMTDDAKQWDGWGTALKPSWEPIVLARKPISEKTVAANVLRWGTGAINVDGCRVGDEGGTRKADTGESVKSSKTVSAYGNGLNGGGVADIGKGRFPANLIHDGSPEVLAAFPDTDSTGGYPARGAEFGMRGGNRKQLGERIVMENTGGSAARFFYTAKADGDDRLGTKHPTVKPVDLMQWLTRLITPPGGLVLDAFAGTGTTGEAAFREGFRCILVEREAEYQADIRKRMEMALRGSTARKRAHKQAKAKPQPLGGMFEE